MKIFGLLSEGFQNLSAEDHRSSIEKLFQALNSEENFEIVVQDYLIKLDLFTAAK